MRCPVCRKHELNRDASGGTCSACAYHIPMPQLALAESLLQHIDELDEPTKVMLSQRLQREVEDAVKQRRFMDNYMLLPFAPISSLDDDRNRIAVGSSRIYIRFTSPERVCGVVVIPCTPTALLEALVQGSYHDHNFTVKVVGEQVRIGITPHTQLLCGILKPLPPSEVEVDLNRLREAIAAQMDIP